MFIVFMVLFALGIYLFGLGMSAGSALIFLAGMLSFGVSVALLFHLPAARERHDV